VVALALLACVGCEKNKPEPSGPGRIVALDTEVAGLSGLTQDEHGAFWAAGELGDSVLRIDPETLGITRYPVVGLPEGVDLEALTWVDGTRFVLGTETQENHRSRDVILDGRIVGQTFKVAPIGHVDYVRWRTTARNNHGIEGACQVGGTLVFATELALDERGRRWAPLAVFDPATQRWTAHRVALSTGDGKLAALDCRESTGSIEALAVERHYGVARLLRFSVPGGEGQSIEPRVVSDLSTLVAPVPNFEGLVWMEDGSAVLLTDNQYRGSATEPSRLYFIPASQIQ
jgi:hypothetical protein